MRNFRTYQIAVQFYRLSQSLKLRNPLREQLARASSSVALNLAEGRGRRTVADQVRFFNIALGSVRECKAILDLAEVADSEAAVVLDKLGASLYCLIRKAGG